MAGQAEIVNLLTGETKKTLSIAVDRDRLLDGFDWPSPLRNEIASLPEGIEITPLVQEMTSCLDEINTILIDGDFPELITNALFVQHLMQSVPKEIGTPCICWYDRASASYATVSWAMRLEQMPCFEVEAVLSTRPDVSTSET